MASFTGLLLLSLALLIALAGATQFKVGGSMGWGVPTDSNAMSYNQWAERNRFMIGDSLLFVYPANKDSVLQVDKDAYNNCNTSSYIAKFSNGNTVFTFNSSGPFFFISGDKQNCLRKEALNVVVMANRSNHVSVANQSSIAPPPPSPTPESNSPTSPPPSSSMEVPPPSPASISPPSSSVEVPPPAPEPAGAGEVSKANPPPPSPNGATLKVGSFIGSVEALIGLLFIVL